jgi:TonB family protein
MIDILTQATARLDRSRAVTLLDPTVERRNRRWGAQAVDEETVDSAEAASAVRPAAALSNGSHSERFRRGGGSQSEPESPRISQGSPASGALSPPTYAPGTNAPGTNAPAGDPGEGPGERSASESRRPEPDGAPQRLPVATHPGPRVPDREPKVERPEHPAWTSSALRSEPSEKKGQARPPLRMAGFAEACVERPLAPGSLPGRAAEAGFPKAAPGSELAAGRSKSVGRAGAPAHDDPFAEPTGALTSPVQILSKPGPRYPEEALRRGLQGDVLLDVEFRFSGAVEVLGVRRGLGRGLDESAIEAARKMRFVPARRDGRPVDAQATLRIRFQLLQ